MKNNNLFICLLDDVLDCAEKEKNTILDGKESLWNLEQIQKSHNSQNERIVIVCK